MNAFQKQQVKSAAVVVVFVVMAGVQGIMWPVYRRLHLEWVGGAELEGPVPRAYAVFALGALVVQLAQGIPLLAWSRWGAPAGRPFRVRWTVAAVLLSVTAAVELGAALYFLRS